LNALVSSNVYDSASGRYLLIPQGARLIGGYNPRVGYGQDGVQVVWDRVIYPDGSSLDLSGMVGQDAHGASGFRDKVDRHHNASVSPCSRACSPLHLRLHRTRTAPHVPEPAQVAGSAADLGAQITRRNLNVQPTIKIPVGYRLNVPGNRDFLFDGPYEPDSPVTQTLRR
jgi:type IV secretion system protein VirB10